MHITWGTYQLGRVDVVDGLFYVTTRYWHFCYVPLIPLDGCLVLQGPYQTYPGGQARSADDQFEGYTIGLSWKCVLLTWVRVVLWPTASILAMAAYIAFAEAGRNPARREARIGVAWMLAAFAGLAFAALGFTYWWSRAGYERAIAIAEQFGLDTGPVDEAFGRPPGPPVS